MMVLTIAVGGSPSGSPWGSKGATASSTECAAIQNGTLTPESRMIWADWYSWRLRCRTAPIRPPAAAEALLVVAVKRLAAARAKREDIMAVVISIVDLQGLCFLQAVG